MRVIEIAAALGLTVSVVQFAVGFFNPQPSHPSVRLGISASALPAEHVAQRRRRRRSLAGALLALTALKGYLAYYGSHLASWLGWARQSLVIFRLVGSPHLQFEPSSGLAFVVLAMLLPRGLLRIFLAERYKNINARIAPELAALGALVILTFDIQGLYRLNAYLLSATIIGLLAVYLAMRAELHKNSKRLLRDHLHALRHDSVRIITPFMEKLTSVVLWLVRLPTRIPKLLQDAAERAARRRKEAEERRLIAEAESAERMKQKEAEAGHELGKL